MPARSFLRGRSAFIAFVTLSLCAGGVKAQEILKELEQSDQDATKVPSGHNHEHGVASGSKKAPKEGKGHGEHQHATSKENKKGGGHKHTAPGDKGGKHTGSHDTSHPGAGTHGDQHQMHGFLGPYPIQREGSGTSWLPDATPHFGVHATYGDWQTMYHALFNLVYDHQGGPRGGDKTFVNGMFMGMAQRPFGEGTFGLRAMLSPDPFMGANGYPLIFATGETADGRTHLIDRQHPHDLFMELATTYSYAFNKNSSVYVYAGLPGEPALGPSAFMHRTSGMDIPEAPITHHWLDSTHITFGVVTAGVVLNTWKIEASAFKGREPDQYRYDIEAPKLDSYSGRISWNPIQQLSFQVSWGHLQSPEKLEPDRNEDRFTVSAIYTQPFGKDNVWSTTAAWGRKMMKLGDTLDGFILETAAIFQKKYTLFARAERVQENELLDLEPAPVFTVNKLTAGGIYDFFRTDHAQVRRRWPCEFLRRAERSEASLWRPDERNGFCEAQSRMKKLIPISIFGAGVISAALAHEGHEHATGVVRERMELMTSIGQRMLASSKRLRANKDLESITNDAGAIHELASKIPAQFPPGSTQFPTAAKPAIWQEWDDFTAKAKRLETESEKLMNTNTKDGDALRAQFRAVAFACDGCHEKYRVPKEKR